MAEAITPKTMEELSYRVQKGYRKYGALECNQKTLGALTLEVEEVREAIQRREDWKVRAELLDVATVCIRRAQAIDERNGK